MTKKLYKYYIIILVALTMLATSCVIQTNTASATQKWDDAGCPVDSPTKIQTGTYGETPIIWDVIGYHDKSGARSGIAGVYDTVTLLLDKQSAPVAKKADLHVKKIFDGLYQYADSDYLNSGLDIAMREYYYAWVREYDYNINGEHISNPNIKYVPRNLRGGSQAYQEEYAGSGQFGYDPDRIQGKTAKSNWFWPLSVEEVSALSPDVRSFGSDYWLRTPGSRFDLVQEGSSKINIGGQYVTDNKITGESLVKVNGSIDKNGKPPLTIKEEVDLSSGATYYYETKNELTARPATYMRIDDFLAYSHLNSVTDAISATCKIEPTVKVSKGYGLDDVNPRYKFNVIGYNAQGEKEGLAGPDGSATLLLSKDSPTHFNNTIYNPKCAQDSKGLGDKDIILADPESVYYKNSRLQASIVSDYAQLLKDAGKVGTTTKFGMNDTDVVTRTLENVDTGSTWDLADKISGPNVESQALWPLSTLENSNLDDTLKVDESTTWIRDVGTLADGSRPNENNHLSANIEPECTINGLSILDNHQVQPAMYVKVSDLDISDSDSRLVAGAKSAIKGVLADSIRWVSSNEDENEDGYGSTCPKSYGWMGAYPNCYHYASIIYSSETNLSDLTIDVKPGVNKTVLGVSNEDIKNRLNIPEQAYLYGWCTSICKSEEDVDYKVGDTISIDDPRTVKLFPVYKYVNGKYQSEPATRAGRVGHTISMVGDQYEYAIASGECSLVSISTCEFKDVDDTIDAKLINVDKNGKIGLTTFFVGETDKLIIRRKCGNALSSTPLLLDGNLSHLTAEVTATGKIYDSTKTATSINVRLYNLNGEFTSDSAICNAEFVSASAANAVPLTGTCSLKDNVNVTENKHNYGSAQLTDIYFGAAKISPRPVTIKLTNDITVTVGAKTTDWAELSNANADKFTVIDGPLASDGARDIINGSLDYVQPESNPDCNTDTPGTKVGCIVVGIIPYKAASKSGENGGYVVDNNYVVRVQSANLIVVQDHWSISAEVHLVDSYCYGDCANPEIGGANDDEAIFRYVLVNGATGDQVHDSGIYLACHGGYHFLDAVPGNNKEMAFDNNSSCELRGENVDKYSLVKVSLFGNLIDD